MKTLSCEKWKNLGMLNARAPLYYPLKAKESTKQKSEEDVLQNQTENKSKIDNKTLTKEE